MNDSIVWNKFKALDLKIRTCQPNPVDRFFIFYRFTRDSDVSFRNFAC